ncbi:15071_t:CDS:2 [Entrophospora sp. SA101]|nr:15071_t:CDS:2 [Entrophospora sp. SA101]
MSAVKGKNIESQIKNLFREKLKTRHCQLGNQIQCYDGRSAVNVLSPSERLTDQVSEPEEIGYMKAHLDCKVGPKKLVNLKVLLTSFNYEA